MSVWVRVESRGAIAVWSKERALVADKTRFEVRHRNRVFSADWKSWLDTIELGPLSDELRSVGTTVVALWSDAPVWRRTHNDDGGEIVVDGLGVLRWRTEEDVHVWTAESRLSPRYRLDGTLSEEGVPTVTGYEVMWKIVDGCAGVDLGRERGSIEPADDNSADVPARGTRVMVELPAPPGQGPWSRWLRHASARPWGCETDVPAAPAENEASPG